MGHRGDSFLNFLLPFLTQKKNGNNGHNKHSIMNIESTSAFAEFNFSFYKLVMKPVNNI